MGSRKKLPETNGMGVENYATNEINMVIKQKLSDSEEILIKRFIDTIVEREKYVNVNPKRANKLFDEIHSIFKELRKKKQLKRLEPLMEHNNNSVVNFAAKYYLIVDEKKAINKLKELAKSGGMIAFEINILIDQWKKGEVTFNY
ncbi:hypothetical protein DN752_22205 [Echinicola strongylocentroti]|uniref:Uncharacterized protein n=1 Tax=Echinicola strongylocentroti TaxID=1795355 RepID=A0A2Z4IPF4_9BACT|nr:DUF2019 domain-containing protein [Echinicola strongylocentroti]AWW32640.1 hypothetical protein DN752_22205 [Echinicola strongylocentroti]